MNLLADIKDAGILAGFELWGWPYHGLCTDGVIDLGGGLSHTIATPSHGSAWLYDLGLPAIDRTPDQLIADASLGHSWTNYSMISGGVLYGTRLGANQFIHVDANSVPWLVSLAYSYPEASLQRVRITLSIVRFGLFGEGVLTPIEVVRDVQCSSYMYSMSGGYTYNGPTTSLLEDVWTNGIKCLVSVAQTRVTTPVLKDIFSLIEVVFSGTGGADGSGLVIAASEIMTDVQLSKGPVSGIDNTPLDIQQTDGSQPFIWSGSSPSWTPSWGNSNIYWRSGVYSDCTGQVTGSNNNSIEFYPYARFAYYNAAGVPKAARLMKKKMHKTTFISATRGSIGSLVKNKTNCQGSTGLDDYLHDTAWLTQSTTAIEEHSFGVFLLENDTVIDKLEIYQSFVVTQDFLLGGRFSGLPETGMPVCDERVFPARGCAGGWGTLGGDLYHANDVIISQNSPVWSGSLSAMIGLGAPPHINDWYVDASGNPIEPLAIDDLTIAWRSNTSNHETSGTAVVRGTSQLSIQRIDAKAAAFYIPGSTRTYGPVLTPLGIKTAGITPAANLYLAWQRKTGDFTFSASPICYV